VVQRLVEEARQQELTELDGARLQWLREILHDGNPGDATRVFELADWARRSAAGNDIDLALDLLLGAGLRCWWSDTGAPARSAVIDVLDELDAHTDPRSVAALAVTEPVLRGQQVHDLLSQPRFDASNYEDGDALRLLGMAAHAIGDSPRAAALLDASEGILRRRGQQGLLAHVLSMQVIIRLELGDLARAKDAVEEGLRLAQLTGQPIWNTGTLVCAARAEAMVGNTQKAFDLATQAELAAGRARLNDLLACVAMAQGLAHLDWGDPESAYLSFRSLFDPSSPNFHQRERFDGVMFLARAAALAGQIPDARAFFADLEMVAAVTPAPLLHAQLHYARAVLSEDDEREDAFRRSLAADLSDWPWIRGQLSLSFGRLLLRDGRPEEAVAHLESSAQIFRTTGAMLWAEQAEQALLTALEEAG
jgi:tetratricopeptide (TPR) repeat protein